MQEDMGKIKVADYRYVTVREWREDLFEYHEWVVNLGRMQVPYGIIAKHHNPPLVYISAERTL